MNRLFYLVKNYYKWEHAWAILNVVCINTAFGALLKCYSQHSVLVVVNFVEYGWELYVHFSPKNGEIEALFT